MTTEQPYCAACVTAATGGKCQNCPMFWYRTADGTTAGFDIVALEIERRRVAAMADDEYVAWKEPNLREKALALTPRPPLLCEVCETRFATTAATVSIPYHEPRTAAMCLSCAEAVAEDAEQFLAAHPRHQTRDVVTVGPWKRIGRWWRLRRADGRHD